ncbi:hypothetical protein [Dapis sp. BLCC M229]|uniref:hypothetical protein n=1 Tax=Dapis sp. BLCC M229 TaxID=3400188 RepID=UPI003CF75404
MYSLNENPQERNSHFPNNYSYGYYSNTSSVELSTIYSTSSPNQKYKWEKFSKLEENCQICNDTHKRCSTNGSLVICGQDWQVPNWKNLLG